MISCLRERTRKKVRSFCGSRSRTTLRALAASWEIKAEYCKVYLLSRVDRIGTPSLFTITMPDTPLWVLILFRVSSTSDIAGVELLGRSALRCGAASKQL